MLKENCYIKKISAKHRQKKTTEIQKNTEKT